jgi:hypothetical protein
MDETKRRLRSEERILAYGLELRLRAGGLEARPVSGGQPLIGQRAFWFAWSQFHPRTIIWRAP